MIGIFAADLRLDRRQPGSVGIRRRLAHSRAVRRDQQPIERPGIGQRAEHFLQQVLIRIAGDRAAGKGPLRR